MQTVEIPPALVVLGRVALAVEPFQRREAGHAELAAQVLVAVGVDLGDLDLVLGELVRVGELVVHRRQVLAVAAPGREELDERGFAGFEDDRVEVGRVEVEDSRCGGGCYGEGRHEDLFERRHGDAVDQIKHSKGECGLFQRLLEWKELVVVCFKSMDIFDFSAAKGYVATST